MLQSWPGCMLGAKITSCFLVLLFSYGTSSADLNCDSDIITEKCGTLEQLRKLRITPPQPRETLAIRPVKIPVVLYRQKIRDGCYLEAYLPLEDQFGEFFLRQRSFISLLAVSWQNCGDKDDFIVYLDDKQLHLPQLLPIVQKDPPFEIIAFAARDFKTPQPFDKAEHIFFETNQYAWDVKKYSL